MRTGRDSTLPVMRFFGGFNGMFPLFFTIDVEYRTHQTTNLCTNRVWDGKWVITDGPFAETKEQIGGFVLLEANDLNEAIQLAVRIPPARLGGVQMRPVIENPALEYWNDKG